MRDRTKGKGFDGKGKSRSKLRSRKIKCFECHENRHIRKNCPKLKGKNKDGDSFDTARFISAAEVFNDVGTVIAISISNSSES